MMPIEAPVAPEVMTPEAFEEYALLPEHRDKRLEFIDGRIIELVSQDHASNIAANTLISLGSFVRQHKLGRVTGADGGYKVMNERYIPDVAFVSNKRQPEPAYKAYNPIAPDLAVEVISPTDNLRELSRKIVNYLLAGTVVWVIEPQDKTVDVYVPGQMPVTLDINGVIDGGAVLPGFTLAVSDIFA
jgi:Uma2 family endonuclease